VVNQDLASAIKRQATGRWQRLSCIKTRPNLKALKVPVDLSEPCLVALRASYRYDPKLNRNEHLGWRCPPAKLAVSRRSKGAVRARQALN
jgi:hypothetical protein